MGLGKLKTVSDYEDLRNARILENQNRLRTLGLQKTIWELRSLVAPSPPKSPKPPKRKYTKRVVELSSLRRSDRLKELPAIRDAYTSARRSNRLRGKLFKPISGGADTAEEGSGRMIKAKSVELRPANMPLLKIKGSKACLSPEAEAGRCSSQGRGGVYHPVFGICCHFCRQKKLCGEEDCKRCGNLDVDEPCIGKTDCSVCHSSNGVLCRACLKVRYGEEMEDVIANKEWMCPHCIEEKGTIPYWMCNSSFCLKKRKIAPTGIAIFRAKELGYKSVAHLLMDELRGTIKKKR